MRLEDKFLLAGVALFHFDRQLVMSLLATGTRRWESGILHLGTNSSRRASGSHRLEMSNCHRETGSLNQESGILCLETGSQHLRTNSFRRASDSLRWGFDRWARYRSDRRAGKG